jgi:hypothetical protein
LQPLRLDSFLPEVHLDETHLQSYSTPSGVASSDNAMTNSGEFVRSDVQNREIWGGVEMEEEKNQFTSELQAFYRERRGCFCLLLAGDGRDPAAA